MATSGDSAVVNGQLQSTSEAAKILKAGRLTKQGKIVRANLFAIMEMNGSNG